MFNYKKQLPGIDRSSDKNKMGRASSSALQMNTREYTTGPMPGMAASKLGLSMKRGKSGCKCGAKVCKC